MNNIYQAGRMVDVILYGPFLIWLSFHARPPWVKAALLLGGAITIASNLRNYGMVEDVSSGRAPAETLLGMGEV